MEQQQITTTADAAQTTQQDALTTVFVTNIAPASSEKTVSDFFSFCGTITSLTLRSKAADGTQEAVIRFDSEAAAKTALLLTNALIVDRPIVVAKYDPTISPVTETDRTWEKNEINNKPHQISADQRTQTSVIASLIAAGYKLGADTGVRAREWDEQHNITSGLASTAEVLKARAEALDKEYKISETAQAWKTATTDKISEVDRQYGISSTVESWVQQADDMLKQVEHSQPVLNAVNGIKAASASVASYTEGVKTDASKYIQSQETLKAASDKIQNVSNQVQEVVQETNDKIREVDDQQRKAQMQQTTLAKDENKSIQMESVPNLLLPPDNTTTTTSTATTTATVPTVTTPSQDDTKPPTSTQ